jgi:homocysteine S-methyltransferase
MGDPTQIGDYPEAMDNYDIVPSGLIQLIKNRLNYGLDQAGRKIDQPTRFTVGCGLNLEPADAAREMKLIQKKMQNGADFAVTQPVFNPKAAGEFIRAFEKDYGAPMLPIIAGIQPLYSASNAEFLHNEVPGIMIPDAIRERMKGSRDPTEVGVIIAQEILEELRPVVQGAYLIPAFGRYDLIADVLEAVERNP